MAIKQSKSREAAYSQYKTGKVQERNRLKKLERQLKLQPGNSEQILKAIDNVRYRRATPKEPYWSHQMIETANRMKRFLGRFDKNFFNPDPKVSSTATTQNEKTFSQYKQPTVRGSMFSLRLRIGQ